MMMAVGCIQSQRCHTNTCPVGVATQDPKRMRALVVEDEGRTCAAVPTRDVSRAPNALMAAMGVDGPGELNGGI